MGRGGDFEVDPEALARAEAALSALSDDYLRWVKADLAALSDTIAGLRSADPAEWLAAKARLFAIAHDIKGQAATFGFPLLTSLGHTLCREVENAAADAALVDRLEALSAAMVEVISLRLEGDGGARGRDLLARLDLLAPALSGAD